MYSHCCLVLAGLFGLGLSQISCPVAIGMFLAEHDMEIPSFCQKIQNNLTNDVSYRLILSDSDVNDICDVTNNRICYEALQDITIACARFAKKDINCLDSAAIINTGLCTISDKTSNTLCYTSLSKQGVIDSPDMLVPCLSAYINGDDCSSSCNTVSYFFTTQEIVENSLTVLMLSKADCCFVSYYAFMIDVILNSNRSQVFENDTVFSNDFWEWCGLPVPKTCDDVNFMDFSRRNDSFTCDPSQPLTNNTTNITTTVGPPPDTPDSGMINKPKLLNFIILFIFFMLLFI